MPLMFSRKQLVLGTLCYTAIIVYGSLVPFHFQALSLNEFSQQLNDVVSQPILVFSKSDFLANILLFVPLSFLLMGSCCFGRSSPGWRLLIPVIFFSVLLGACIECLQLMFPPRKASLNDVLAQAIGSTLGGLLWIFAGTTITNRVNELSQSANRTVRFLPLYLLIVVILETVPFDFTLSPVEVVHKWREGRISVIPFATFLDPERSMITKSLWNIVLFLPVGLLLSYIPRMHGLKAAVVGLLIAGSIEIIQLPVLSRNFESTDILTGGFAIWLGWWAMNLHSTFIAVRERQRTTNYMYSILLMVWFIVVAGINWYPFDFTGAGAFDRLAAIPLIPFADYQQKHYLSAFDDIIHKLLLFVLLGLLLSANPAQRRNAVTVACMGALFSAMIELGQVFLPSRYPSLSDVVLGLIACYAGHSLVAMLRNAGQSAIPLRVNHQV